MIPEELKKLRQWCCSTADSKAPLNPRTLELASPTDPRTWGTYDEAVATGMPRIGFVLSHDDPYTIIDLDKPTTDDEKARHSKIFAAFDSYTETSQSGQGVHIIVRGKVPAGARRDHVEVYSDSRYMITTGNILRNAPIEECQPLLDELYRDLNGGRNNAIELCDGDAVDDDSTIVERASAAENGAKFDKLCSGEWQGDYESQSEADYALLSILAFYSKNNAQVRRLFRMSVLGQREKAQKNDVYLNRSLKRIRASETPLVDLSQFVDKPLAPVKPLVPNPPPKKAAVTVMPRSVERFIESGDIVEKKVIEYPPGLVGDIAEYIRSTSIRPVHEVGLVAALGLISGIVGRSYNVSGTGLNQYLIFVANTGSGKEGIASGIGRIVNAVRDHTEAIDNFIGPGAFASGQALMRKIHEKPCFVSILGEFGLTLQKVCDVKATSADKMIKHALLDLYAKSGHGQRLMDTAYSDKQRDNLAIFSPALTIIGETTPDTLFDTLTREHISEGLLPRFSIIEYTGGRPKKNHRAFAAPPASLTKQVAALVGTVTANQANNAVNRVKIDPKAQALLDDFDKYADKMMDKANNNADRELWNRADLKALKMSALLAVGQHQSFPVVSVKDADWAISLVQSDIATIQAKFDADQVGLGDSRMESELLRIIKDYHSTPKATLRSYKVPDRLLDQVRVVPYGYIRRRAKRLAVFSNDRRGAIWSIKLVLADMVLGGVLTEVSKEQMLKEFGLNSPAYIIN